MSNILRAAFVVATVGMAAAATQAQQVAMYGEYHESNGIIVNIPQNPPIVPCIPPPLTVLPPPHLTVMGNQSFQHLDLRPTGENNARCHTRGSHINFNVAAPDIFNGPQVGNRGARIINGGLAVGDPFTIPPFAFEQQLGPQVGIVLNSAVKQLDTTFIAAMPGEDRNGPNPGPLPAGGSYTIRTPGQLIPAPALTRMFSQMNWLQAGNGQNNGNPGAGFAARPAADAVITNTEAGGNEVMTMRYTGGDREFGGTMALLLDGTAKLNLAGPAITGMFPASWKPGAATQPVGDGVPGFRVRNAAGWDLAVPGFQAAGRAKAFFGSFNTPMGDLRVVVPECGQVGAAANCNEINGFDTYANAPSPAPLVPTPMGGVAPLWIVPGGTIMTLAKATSTKHMFPLTTGTVSIVRVALRNNIHFSETLTGMGHDTTQVTPMGVQERNVGLVAGSYTVRTDVPSGTQMNSQMLGLNLKFTPEPGATVALASGLSLLGVLAYRRRA